MNLVRDQKFRNSAYISTPTNRTLEPRGPGIPWPGKFWRLMANFLCRSFVISQLCYQRDNKASSPSGVRRNSLRNGENEGEQRGRRNTGTDIIQWHNRGPLNPRPPPHNLITPLLLSHPTLLPITRKIPIPVPCRMHCLRRNCSSVRCATRGLNKVGFLLFLLFPFRFFSFSASLAAYLMRLALTYPVWVEEEGGEGELVQLVYWYDVEIREEGKEEKGGWLTGYLRVTF